MKMMRNIYKKYLSPTEVKLKYFSSDLLLEPH